MIGRFLKVLPGPGISYKSSVAPATAECRRRLLAGHYTLEQRLRHHKQGGLYHILVGR